MHCQSATINEKNKNKTKLFGKTIKFGCNSNLEYHDKIIHDKIKYGTERVNTNFLHYVNRRKQTNNECSLYYTFVSHEDNQTSKAVKKSEYFSSQVTS